mgnify:CR=1 FL=1|tara:strand:- start:6640 stop:8013 length:1374 start_codon:yes stop_codon:yes gene_type:complete
MSSKKSTDLIEVIKKRRSIRRFLDKEVNNTLINKIIEAATWAPTTCNQQLWNFIVVKDLATKNKLVDEAASSTLVRRSPAVIVITYEKSNYKEALQSATGAMQNLLLAATYYGLGSCCMNSYGNEKKIKNILKIPKDQLIVCFVTMGYKDSKYYENLSPPPRREISKVMHYGKFRKKRNNVFSYNPDNWTLEDMKQYQRYYCRKTFLGKEMDIATKEEKDVVAKHIAKIKGPVLDWFSYDGSYIKHFPSEKLVTIDLTDETSRYTKEAVRTTNRKFDADYLIYDDSFKKLREKHKKFKTITAIYKFERLPNKFKKEIIKESYDLLDKDGKFIIIFRKKSILYRLFYYAIRFAFGDDIRKTGIYSFFGPYRPIHSRKFARDLKKLGFNSIEKECYFPFPTFFDQAFQMFLQYIKSGGTSYLHRTRKENFFTKLISFLINIYGFRKTRFGTVCVIIAKK